MERLEEGKHDNLDKIVAETGKALKAQPKVKINIQSEKPLWEGSINGWPILIRTNEFVEVPESVAKLIENNTKVIRESEKTLAQYKEGASEPNKEKPKKIWGR